MSEPLKVAVAGVGRMGVIHALHVHELAQETGSCVLAAIADTDLERAHKAAADLGGGIPVFGSVDELAAAGVCNATVVVTPTGDHRDNAGVLVRAGHRVLLEKPLTGTLEGDREFSAELDRDYPNAVMLAFQRRFDAPAQYTKELVDSGIIGRVFKVYSALEDSNPAPNGYKSGGILPDMSVHNIDELLWLTGQMPKRALVIGSRLFSHKLTTSQEDFDDALMYLWVDHEMVAQLQVTRNHVSGYRVETILFGEEGHIHMGRFDQKLFDITVEAYGRRGRTEPLAYKVFPQRQYGRPLPEFIDRFGAAYKAELVAFVDCCRSGAPFPTTHRDGLRAQEVVSMGMASIIGAAEESAAT